ncbi:Prx1p [Sugiyamaella lignohabitans]|uniref:Prx1p n=1 Tax=Sugiyamaella lignohabitans TaxID=796027 RepID=A0A167CJS0_9ASCO|nr:Prx1p [Sugiyamaella lignohabitans]ANB11790.1 Prx1p [Sugiyamaella lignohabitans]
MSTGNHAMARAHAYKQEDICLTLANSFFNSIDPEMSVLTLARKTLLTSARRSRSGARIVVPAVRHFAFNAADQPRIRIGSTAPNFKALTTDGEIDFHEFVGDSWTILFSHPADFTPVCTTELGAFAALQEEFTKRNAKLIGLSADGLESHGEWVKDIEETSTSGKKFDFPIIADKDRNVAFLYDMVDEEGFKNINSGMAMTIRNVFIIDPKKKVRLFLVYPASTGRNTAEVLRVLDALQLADGQGIATPVDWVPGKDVIVPVSVSTSDAAKKFGEVREVKPYLRFVKHNVKSSVLSLFGGPSYSSSSNYTTFALIAAGVGAALVGSEGLSKDSRVADLENVVGK